MSVLCLSGLGLVFSLPAASSNASTMAAVFPPWWSRADVWRSALSVGDVVDAGGSQFVLILHSNKTGLSVRLRRAGALLVLDPKQLGVCGQTPTKEAIS